MHGRRRGDDVARRQPRAVVALPVGHHSPGFAHDERAGGDVPRTEVLLEVAVEHTGRGPDQVQARGARTAQVLECEQRALEHREVLGQSVALRPEREAGRTDRALGDTFADAQRFTIAKRAASEPRRVHIAQHRRVDDADHGDAVGHERDRHPHHRESVHEVGGAVERVHEPTDVGALATALLPEERQVGRGVVQHGPYCRFARRVSVADPVTRTLLPHVARAAERVGHDRGTGRGRGERGVEERVEIEVDGVHGVSPSWSEARSSGVPAASSCRRAAGSRATNSRCSASTTGAPASTHTKKPPR